MKIDETKLNKDTIVVEQLDGDTCILYFDTIQDDKGDDVQAIVELWLDEKKWKYILSFEHDNTIWDISRDMRFFVQKQILNYLDMHTFFDVKEFKD